MVGAFLLGFVALETLSKKYLPEPGFILSRADGIRWRAENLSMKKLKADQRALEKEIARLESGAAKELSRKARQDWLRSSRQKLQDWKESIRMKKNASAGDK